MIKDLIRKIEIENGELELLYNKPYENDYGYVEFSLKTMDNNDIVLRVDNSEKEILKFLLIYRIISNVDKKLTEKISKLIIFEEYNIVKLLYRLKKNRIDINKSIEDIVKFRSEDLVNNIVHLVKKVIRPIDTYSLVNITVGELDSLLSEDFNIYDFKKGRYKIFSYLADELIESKKDKNFLSREERALIKSTILSLALRKKENIYYISKEIIREMTTYIKDKIELNTEKIIEVVRDHNSYKGYEFIKNYDSNALMNEENSNIYEKLSVLLFIIPFLYCEVIETEEDNIEYLELERESKEDFKMEKNITEMNEINEEVIIKEVQKFKKIIPSAKQMASRYYNRRKQIIDEQFKFILESLNNADLIREIEANFLLIEEVKGYLLEQGYKLEEVKNESKTIIKW